MQPVFGVTRAYIVCTHTHCAHTHHCSLGCVTKVPLKGRFTCSYSFPLANLAKQALQEVWTWLLFLLQCLVSQQPTLVGPALEVEADHDDGWWRGPHTPAPDCHCHRSRPQSCRLFTEAADANSLSGDTGQRRTLDLHILE